MQDLTTGSVTRHLLKTTGFMLVTMIFQTLYFLIDLFWVGRLGKEAVAAVSIAGNLMFVVLAVTQMLAVGTTTLVSHAAGRKDHARAHFVFNQAVVLSVLVGVLFAIAATLSRRAYTHALSADATTEALANTYLAWFIPAMSLQYFMSVMSAALRGTGNFKPGMVVQTATVILNMILAPFLIFGWGTGHAFGVAGAAASTVIAIVVGSVWMVTYFLPAASYLKFVSADWTPDGGVWKGLLGIGLPAGAEFGLMAVYLFIIYTVSRPFGAAAQAGFGIGLRIIQALFMPVVALGFSVAPVAGQNVGARLADRVRETFKAAIGLSIAIMAVLTIVCQLAPAALIRIFSKDPGVVAIGAEYLHIVSWSFVVAGVVFVASSMFQALGNTMPALVASFVRILLVGIPVVLLSRLPNFTLRWAWYISVSAAVIQMTLSLLLLRREFYRKLVVPLVPTAGAPIAPAGA
jgi:putative MATE family efflux protein